MRKRFYSFCKYTQVLNHCYLTITSSTLSIYLFCRCTYLFIYLFIFCCSFFLLKLSHKPFNLIFTPFIFWFLNLDNLVLMCFIDLLGIFMQCISEISCASSGLAGDTDLVYFSWSISSLSIFLFNPIFMSVLLVKILLFYPGALSMSKFTIIGNT